jgi:hypothetical protein
MVSDTTKVAVKPEKVYDNVAKSLYKENSPKFPSIQTSEYRDYVSYFKIKTVDDFKKSLGIGKGESLNHDNFSKMKMVEKLNKEKERMAAKEVSHTGIFAVINSQGAQNVVLVRNELTPAQLREVTEKAHAISAERLVETKARKKAPKTEGEQVAKGR